MEKETIKYINLLKNNSQKTMEERLFHALHMELTDSIVIKNVTKLSDSKAIFEYHENKGELFIKGFNVILNYGGLTRNVNSYMDIVNILCKT